MSKRGMIREKSGFVADHSTDPLTGQPWEPGEKPKRAKNTKGLTVVSQGPVDVVTESLTGNDAPDWAKTVAEREADREAAFIDPDIEVPAGKLKKSNRKATKARKAEKAAKAPKAAKKTTKAAKKAKKGITRREVLASKTLVKRAKTGPKPGTAEKAAKKRAAKAAQPKTPRQPKAEGRGATIVAMVSQKGGASLAAIMGATGWQAHSVRGFLSTAAKKGLAVASYKSEAGERIYHLIPSTGAKK